MHSDYSLINTIVASIVVAFIFGLIAKRMKLPSLIGYLAAGMALGPFTPGYVADGNVAHQLAEIGVILLMFGVGLHFKVSDLMKVRNIALPGAIFQMAVATVAGAAMALMAGYDIIESAVFGFSLSVASTVVLLRALEARDEVTSSAGKIAVGWLIVEDIAMVLAIVLLPVVGEIAKNDAAIDWGEVSGSILGVLVKIAALVIVMITIGRRALPKLLILIAKTKSRELMSLGTLAIALGFAFIAYMLFDASFALGAFLAGLVLNESEIGRKSAEQSLPLRDTFAVLFFVSVGMLFNPDILWMRPVMVFCTLVVIIACKALAAFAITKLLRQDSRTGIIIAASLAQIGEFSFIFAGMGLMGGLLSQDLYNLVLAGSILSIGINPFLFKAMDRKLVQA